MSKVTLDDIVELFDEAGIESNVSELDPKKALLDQGLDSLDMMNVFFQVEEKYGLSVGEEEIAAGDWNSLEKIVESVNKNQQ